ncbi:MAG TPA: hypothetical protein VIS75_11690 [Chitinophagaceae bacterium]|jgi:hypothetical protein
MRFLIFVLVVLFLTTSCKKNNENENSICFTRTATQLKIENNTNKVLYIASFGQNILPLIDWAATCGNNNVQPNSYINRELSSIAGYSDNDKLVVYWWECTNGNVQQMYNVILDSNQTDCQ